MKILIDSQDLDSFLEEAEKEAVRQRKYVLGSAINTIRGNLLKFMAAEREVIHCRECIGFEDEEEDNSGSGFCYMWGSETEANEFCSYAKRRKPDE